jgi:hypothetical protein
MTSPQGNGHADARDGLHERRVRREAGEHFAGTRYLEEQRIEAHDAVVHGGAQVRDDALTQPRDEVEPQGGEDAENERRDQEPHEVTVDGARAARCQPQVDEVAERHRQREQGHRRDDESAQCQNQRATVGPEKRQQRTQRLG